MRHTPTAQLRAASAALAVLLCLGSAPLAQAVDWCQPRLLLTMPALQPCSNPSHCCSIWVSDAESLVFAATSAAA